MIQRTLPTSPTIQASEEAHDHAKEAIVDHAQRVEEAWDSLPGHEAEIDYSTEAESGYIPPYLERFPGPRQFTASSQLMAYKELRVEIIVNTPDGRRFATEESMEYELNDHGFPPEYMTEHAFEMLERVHTAAGENLPGDL